MNKNLFVSMKAEAFLRDVTGPVDEKIYLGC